MCKLETVIKCFKFVKFDTLIIMILFNLGLSITEDVLVNL